MKNEPMENDYLYTTTVPVLLGNGKQAWKTASEICLRHDVTPHWFGRGMDFRLVTRVRRHILPAPLFDMSDALLLQILLDFAAEQLGLLTLFPCDGDAEDFVNRNLPALESRYVILPPRGEGDPLAPLVRKNC